MTCGHGSLVLIQYFPNPPQPITTNIVYRKQLACFLTGIYIHMCTYTRTEGKRQGESAVRGASDLRELLACQVRDLPRSYIPNPQACYSFVRGTKHTFLTALCSTLEWEQKRIFSRIPWQQDSGSDSDKKKHLHGIWKAKLWLSLLANDFSRWQL
jgi:hypothetical protein